MKMTGLLPLKVLTLDLSHYIIRPADLKILESTEIVVPTRDFLCEIRIFSPSHYKSKVKWCYTYIMTVMKPFEDEL